MNSIGIIDTAHCK